MYPRPSEPIAPRDNKGSEAAGIIPAILGRRHNLLSGRTVAMKTLLLTEGGCKEDLHRQFIKEVDIIYVIVMSHIYV